MQAARGRDWEALSGDVLASLLTAPVRSRTPHFSLHCHIKPLAAAHLPTDEAPERRQSVDNTAKQVLGLALVVPKRHARHAVTRNLVKRQMREAMRRRLAAMTAHDWLIRLRVPFDVRQFPSAASPALRSAVRAELEQLLSSATLRL